MILVQPLGKTSVTLAIAAVLAGCGGPKSRAVSMQAPTELLSRVTTDEWRHLASLRIAFGHQSVGYDIVAGLEDVARGFPQAKLNVIESAAGSTAVGLVHFRAGQNELPMTKVDAFVRFIDGSRDAAPQIALLKFCYVDVTPATDVRAVFSYYRDALADLRRRYPATSFVHVTMPLQTVQSGWKASVKNLLGRPIGGHADNLKRHEYNELLRAQYGGSEPIFDLAAIESTRPNGSRVLFSTGGRTAFGLAPDYTHDGGHLNEVGRSYVAAHLLLAFAEAAKPRRPDKKS